MTSPQTYGVSVAANPAESHAMSEIRRQGYTVLPGPLPAGQQPEGRRRLDQVYAGQERAFDRDALAAIKELHLARWIFPGALAANIPTSRIWPSCLAILPKHLTVHDWRQADRND